MNRGECLEVLRRHGALSSGVPADPAVYVMAEALLRLEDRREQHREIAKRERVQREALEAIARMTDADNPESYRCDDREGCLDAVYARADAALSASATQMHVSVDEGLAY